MKFEPLKPRNLGRFEDANIKREIDWMALCVTLAESQMDFVKFVRKLLPNNAVIQGTSDKLKQSISEVLSIAAMEKSKR